MEPISRPPAPGLYLPVLMSLDNLAYGAGLGQVTGAVLAQALGL